MNISHENNPHEDPSQDNNYPILSLKIVFILSLALIFLDILEIIFLFSSMQSYSTSLSLPIFQSCIKYQSIAEAFFSLFGVLAGISLALLTFGLIIDSQYFFTKAMNTFIYYNYCIFGPYLLTSSILGLYFFEKIAYQCDAKNMEHKSLNITMAFCLFFTFFTSMFVTVVYSFTHVKNILVNSIRFNPGGNIIVGIAFWKCVLGSVNIPQANANLDGFESENI